MNKIILIKLGYHLINNLNSLWVKVLRAKYGCENYFPIHLKARSGCSNIWRGIYSVWDLIWKGISWQVGDGKLVKFWKDNWLEGLGPIDSIAC